MDAGLSRLNYISVVLLVIIFVNFIEPQYKLFFCVHEGNTIFFSLMFVDIDDLICIFLYSASTNYVSSRTDHVISLILARVNLVKLIRAVVQSQT